jgi:hypothetical protein
MRRSPVWFSRPEALNRTLSLVGFITITSGFRFSVHTDVALPQSCPRDVPKSYFLVAAPIRSAGISLRLSISRLFVFAYTRAGKLRALAVTTTARSELLPDLPTLGDFVPGYESSQWYGIGAPKNTPTEIIDRLNEEINASLGDPKIKARLADLGGTALPGSPADFGKLIAEETEKWGKVVKFAGIKAD